MKTNYSVNVSQKNDAVTIIVISYVISKEDKHLEFVYDNVRYNYKHIVYSQGAFTSMLDCANNRIIYDINHKTEFGIMLVEAAEKILAEVMKTNKTNITDEDIAKLDIRDQGVIELIKKSEPIAGKEEVEKAVKIYYDMCNNNEKK